LSGSTTCAAWDFESGQTDGWAIEFADVVNPSLVTSKSHPIMGTYSLSGRFQTVLEVRVPLCSGAGPANVANKHFQARFYFETTGSLPTQGRMDNQILVTIEDGPNPSHGTSLVAQTFFDPAVGTPPALNVWSSLSGTIQSDSVTAQGVYLAITMLIDDADLLTWPGGVLYLDDIQIY
jgi:hypothetical protein